MITDVYKKRVQTFIFNNDVKKRSNFGTLFLFMELKERNFI